MTIVRAFHPGDAEAVGRIVGSCTAELRQIYLPEPNPPGKSAATGRRQCHTRIVAVDGSGGVVATAECIRRITVLYVRGIAVSPAARRRGMAAALLAHCAGLAADIGLPALEVATIGETGNVGIFRRLGFLVVAERVSGRFRRPDGRPVVEVTLWRRVWGGSRSREADGHNPSALTLTMGMRNRGPTECECR